MPDKLRTLFYFLSAVLSGFMLYASFPPHDLGFLAWFSLTPLLFCILLSERKRSIFVYAFIAGSLYTALHIRWLTEVPNFPLVGLVLIAAYTGLYFGAFALVSVFVDRKTSLPRTLVYPAVFVAFEFMRSNMSFLAIPFGLLGHSQYKYLPIIQLAAITSAYGVSFLLMAANTAIAEICLFVSSYYLAKPFKQKNKKKYGWRLPAAISAVMLVVTVAYGTAVLQSQNGESAYLLNVSVVQPNIPQSKKWDPKYKREIFDRFRMQSATAALEKPDLIVWPETAAPGYLKRDKGLISLVKDVNAESGTYLLLGSGSHAKFNRDGQQVRELRNSAFLLDPVGEILESYDKNILLPFGEYLPLAGKFPWPRWLVPDNGVFTPGDQQQVFDLPGKGRFGVVICWESLFPDFFRNFVAQGAQFMVNMSNEAWFGDTSASKQFLAMSVFRAVEHRISLIRCANTGVSCLINPFGAIVERVADEKGKDIMISGIMTVSVPAMTGSGTFYTAYGDFFAKACSILTLLMIITSCLPAVSPEKSVFHYCQTSNAERKQKTK